jgi:pilus assembly protein Flp/PilA
MNPALFLILINLHMRVGELAPAGERIFARLEREGLSMIRKLFRSRKGATAIEYGLIAALIAVAAIAAMQGLGNQLTKTFDNVSSNMKVS